MDIQLFLDVINDYDAGRARSQQKVIGVSSLGGCRRSVWHSLQGDVGTNPTDNLAAMLGTAIHDMIERAFKKAIADGKVHKDIMLEHRVEIDGFPPATIDYFDPATGEVVDWKTIKLSGIPYFITQQKIWQVQTYAYLMFKSGYDVKTVTLFGIARDGNSKDIIAHSFPFDPAVAENAFAWLADIEARTEAPAPERDAASWCAKYCKFYGELCGGIPKELSGEAITDPFIESAVQDYVNLGDEIKMLEARREGAKSVLAGVSGVTMGGVKVSWSEVKGRETPDTDAIKAALGSVPVKLGMPSMRLTVK
jgi:hypothetical protein